MAVYLQVKRPALMPGKGHMGNVGLDIAGCLGAETAPCQEPNPVVQGSNRSQRKRGALTECALIILCGRMPEGRTMQRGVARLRIFAYAYS